MPTIAPQAAITAYQEAYQKVMEAEVSQKSATDQYEAALNGKNTADANMAAAVAAYNTSIDVAVAALQAAKRGESAPPVAIKAA